MNQKLENESFTPSHIWMVSSEVIRSGIGDIVLRSWADKGIFSVPLEKPKQGVARRYPTKAVYEALLIRILSDHGLDLRVIHHLLKGVQEKLSESDEKVPKYIVLQGHRFPAHARFFDDESLDFIFEGYREMQTVNCSPDDPRAIEVEKAMTGNSPPASMEWPRRIVANFTPHSIRVIKFREMIEQIDDFLLQLVESENR